MESGEQRPAYGRGIAHLAISVAITFCALAAIAHYVGGHSPARVLFLAGCAAWLTVPLMFGLVWDRPLTSNVDRLLAKILAGVPGLVLAVHVVAGEFGGRRIARGLVLLLAAYAVISLLFLAGRLAGRWRDRLSSNGR